ncbi:MAG: trigger factor [Acidobacteriota bacterium]|nr:trigger factor [Acidobacteriota bacterium]
MKKNPCEREVEVEVSAETVSHAWKSALERYQKHASIPGFRKGKVPSSIVLSKFEPELRSEVVEQLAPRAFHEEAKKQNLTPLGQPKIVELTLEEDQPLKFKARFEVLPEFTVDGYKDIHVDAETSTVDEADVEKSLEQMREQSVTYENVDEDRGLADGDFASAAFKSTNPDGTGEPVEMNDVLVEIGGPQTITAFTENLRGVKPSETKSFDVAYPEDTEDKRLAGKTLHYDVEIKGIKKKVVPELNDDWVKELGQDSIQSLDDVRTRIREGLEREKKHEAEHKHKEAILKQLLEKFPFDVPNVLVDDAIDHRLERSLRQLMAQGLQMEMLKRMDLSSLREGQRGPAANDVRANLLLEKIADAEKIEITDEALDKEITEAAMSAGQNPAALRKQMEERNGLEALRSQLRCDHALELLAKQ